MANRSCRLAKRDSGKKFRLYRASSFRSKKGKLIQKRSQAWETPQYSISCNCINVLAPRPERNQLPKGKEARSYAFLLRTFFPNQSLAFRARARIAPTNTRLYAAGLREMALSNPRLSCLIFFALGLGPAPTPIVLPSWPISCLLRVRTGAYDNMCLTASLKRPKRIFIVDPDGSKTWNTYKTSIFVWLAKEKKLGRTSDDSPANRMRTAYYKG